MADLASVTAKIQAALAEAQAVVAVDPPPPVATSAQRVHPSAGLTDCKYLDKGTETGWTSLCGDWLDADGAFNGTKPTLQASGKVATLDISKLGDIIIQGAFRVASITIDGKDAGPFFTDKTSNHSFPIPAVTTGWPNHSTQPVIVPNAGGKSMTITSQSTATFRVDAVATPVASPPAVDASYYRAPDLLSIVPTSFDAVVIPGSIPAASSASNRCFGGAVTYETTNGVAWAKAHCQPIYDPKGGAGRVARCDYPVAPQAELYVSYLLGIGPTVAEAVTDMGVKLSGMTGDNGLLNMGEHVNVYYTRNPRNGSALGLRDQYYSAEAGVGQGGGNEQNSEFSHGYLASPGFTLIEHGAIPNTFTNGVPNQDGHKLTWINGVLVEDRLIKWFANPAYRWNQLSMQIYHGGTKSYAKDCWYGVGPFGASTKRIGVNPAFVPLLATPPARLLTP